MQRLFPTLKYDDAHTAIDFLERAFGFDRHAVHETDDGAVAHAELRFGDDYLMLGATSAGEERFRPARRSSASSPTRIAARASSPPETPRATSSI